MKNFFYCLILMILTLAAPAKSAEVGDIYYHDKTFSNKVDPDKVPIGVVFWVSPDNNFGLIVSLEQLPNTLGVTDADAYCNNFSTLGTNPGDWHLAYADDLFKLGNMYDNKTGKLTNNLSIINNALKNIPTASQLKSTIYVTYNSSYGAGVNLSTGEFTSSNGKFEVRCITGF